MLHLKDWSAHQYFYAFSVLLVSAFLSTNTSLLNPELTNGSPNIKCKVAKMVAMINSCWEMSSSFSTPWRTSTWSHSSCAWWFSFWVARENGLPGWKTHGCQERVSRYPASSHSFSLSLALLCQPKQKRSREFSAANHNWSIRPWMLRTCKAFQTQKQWTTKTRWMLSKLLTSLIMLLGRKLWMVSLPKLKKKFKRMKLRMRPNMMSKTWWTISGPLSPQPLRARKSLS